MNTVNSAIFSCSDISNSVYNRYMADPYREPTDDTSIPPAVATAVSPATPASVDLLATPPIPNGFLPGEGDTLPMPDAPAVASAPTPIAPPVPVAPVEPPPITEPSLGIPESGPGVPPAAPVAPAVPPASEIPAHPEAAISVMPTPASADAKVDKPLREIPLQDIPAAAHVRVPIEPTIIMPPPPPTTTESASMPTVEVAAPVVPSPQETIPQPAPETPARASAIRTLETDIASHVQSNQLSIAQIAMAQKEKDRSVIAAPSDDGGGKSFLFGVMSTILVLGGLGALGFVVYKLSDNFNVPFFDNGNGIATILPAESITRLDVSTTTRVALFSHIESFIQDPGAQALDVRALIFTKQVVSTTTKTEVLSFENFMDLIDSRAPGRLVRTLGPEMMFGTIGNEPFLLARHSSYENAFAGMLEWEPLMRDDLPFLLYTPPERPTFQPKADQPWAGPIATTTEMAVISPESLVMSGTSTATSTQAATTTAPYDSGLATNDLPVIPATWKDIVIRNVDTRALIREDDELLMLYSFVSDDLILITTRKETMAVILDILATPSFGE